MRGESFREGDIRPESLRAGQHEALLTDVGRLLTRRSEFVDVSCPACEARDRRYLFDKYGLNYHECSQCGAWYVSPRPSPQVLEWFYRESVNYAYWNRHIFPASESRRRDCIVVPRVDRLLELCERYVIPTGSVLEVGGAFGTFGVELAARGRFRRVAVVEPTPDLAQTCRARGLEVFECPVEHIESDAVSHFDVVVAFEVIEHLFSPAGFLKKCHALLNPGGMLLLTCPNAAGFDVVTLGANSSTIDHEHLNYFTPASIHRLLQRSGYEMLESSTPGRLDAELVRNEILAGRFDLRANPFLRLILLERWIAAGEAFQDFLAANHLSSNLWVAAKTTPVVGL